MRPIIGLDIPFLLVLGITLSACGNLTRELDKRAANDNKSASSPENSAIVNDSRKISLVFISDQAGMIQPREIGKQSDSYTLRIEGPASSGSGVIVSKEDHAYLFLTAWHVLESHNKGEELSIVTSDGIRHDVAQSSIRRIPNVDLAYATFYSKEEYKQASIESPSRINSGDDLYVAGYPLPTSAVPKSLKRFLTGSVIAISNQQQSDGYELMYSNPTMPGMSGGPVLSNRGGLVGIHGRAESNYMKSGQDYVAIKTGTNQAVPISYFLKEIDGSFEMLQNRKNNKADKLIAEANNRIQVIKDLSIDSNLSDSRDRQIFSALISRAYELVTQAISISDLPSHYYIRGRYRELGLRFDRSNPNYHPHEIVQDFDNAIQLDPEFAKAYLARGRWYAMTSRSEKSIWDLKKSLSLDPYLEQSYVELALPQTSWMGEPSTLRPAWSDDAEAILFRGIEHLPTSSVLYGLMGDLYSNKAYSYLMKRLSMLAVSDDKKCTSTFLALITDECKKYLAQDLQFVNIANSGISHYDLALELDPADLSSGSWGKYRTQRYALKDFIGDFSGAIEDINVLLSHPLGANPCLLLDRADLFIRSKSYKQALIDIDAAVSISEAGTSRFICYDVDRLASMYKEKINMDLVR